MSTYKTEPAFALTIPLSDRYAEKIATVGHEADFGRDDHLPVDVLQRVQLIAVIAPMP